MIGLRRPPLLLGLLVAAAGIAAATGAIYGLKQVAPVVSLSLVYLPVVLLVAAVWGWGLGLACSFASATAFNFFHLPPIGRFTIADSRNWVALAAFTLVALAASAMAAIARRLRAQAERDRAEADLAAALARELLGGTDTATALAGTAHRLAQGLGLASVSLELGDAPGRAGGDAARRDALTLRDADGRTLAHLWVPTDLDPETRARLGDRVLPTVAALVAIALRRDAVQAEAVRTEALRRSDDVKTALLRAVSHDLRTPLTAIVAAGHALASPQLTEPERLDLAEAVSSEGERLAGLVEKLLDLSRLQAGQAAPRRDWLSLDEVIGAARDGLSRDAARRVRVAVPPDLPELRGDAVQLERAIANLLENAARVSPTVTVAARATADRVLVSVVDQGPGVPAAEADRIFEPFYRGAGDGQGSGLGLAIARGFVEAAGGRLTLDSHPGQGASFLIALPREPAG